MTPIIEFLSARLSDEEDMANGVAQATEPSDWWDPEDPDGLLMLQTTEHPRTVLALHPARMLRDIRARRRLLKLHSERPGISIQGAPPPEDRCTTCRRSTWPCRTLRLLAAPYTHHPDYDAQWGE